MTSTSWIFRCVIHVCSVLAGAWSEICLYLTIIGSTSVRLCFKRIGFPHIVPSQIHPLGGGVPAEYPWKRLWVLLDRVSCTSLQVNPTIPIWLAWMMVSEMSAEEGRFHSLGWCVHHINACTWYTFQLLHQTSMTCTHHIQSNLWTTTDMFVSTYSSKGSGLDVPSNRNIQQMLR